VGIGEAQQRIDVVLIEPKRGLEKMMRCAMSSGCSMKFDFDSITPGMIVLPSGSLTRSNRVHSCAWRG
jgi:hypothetical protein